jgi:two-component system, NarL family, sensor kinase
MRRLRSSPVAQFAASGLVAMLAVAAIGVAAHRRVGIDEAEQQARTITRLAGEGIVGPLLTEDLLAGDPRAVRRLDGVVRSRVLGDDVVRVKLWSSDGRIVYSDQTHLIGRQFAGRGEAFQALHEGRATAHIVELSRPEHTYERAAGRLLEVYQPIRSLGGERMLFETYQRYDTIVAEGRQLWIEFGVLLFAGLLLLQLLNLPLAHNLARRLRQGQRQREALLQRALHASETERRLVAADLHDGIVQDLAGVSYSLAAHARDADGEAKGELNQAAAQTRESVRALRAMLVDLYPPSLHRSGLSAALDDLAATYTARGLPTKVAVEPSAHPGEVNERLLFRGAQEAMRNAYKHADAHQALLKVRANGEGVTLEVTDDGRGFDAEARTDGAPNGHFGLRLLRDLFEEAGGEVHVRSTPGGGTTVKLAVPRQE